MDDKSTPVTAPAEEHYSLRWHNHPEHLLRSFTALLQEEKLVDVTLVCIEHRVRAHKVLLSACSPLFRQIFSENPCEHPVIVLKDFQGWEVQAVVDFMYRGEVSVAQEQLSRVIQAGEALQVRGLVDHDRDENLQSPLQIPMVSSPREATPPAVSPQFSPSTSPQPRRKQARPRRRSGEADTPENLSMRRSPSNGLKAVRLTRPRSPPKQEQNDEPEPEATVPPRMFPTHQELFPNVPSAAALSLAPSHHTSDEDAIGNETLGTTIFENYFSSMKKFIEQRKQVSPNTSQTSEEDAVGDETFEKMFYDQYVNSMEKYVEQTKQAALNLSLFGMDPTLAMFPPGMEHKMYPLIDVDHRAPPLDAQLFNNAKKKLGKASRRDRRRNTEPIKGISKRNYKDDKGRPKGQHSAPRGGPPRSWTNGELTNALQCVWNKKMTTSQASRVFGIPYNSLLMYVRGKYGKSLKLEQLRKDCTQGSLDMINSGNNNNNHHSNKHQHDKEDQHQGANQRPASSEPDIASNPIFNPFQPNFYPEFAPGFPVPLNMLHNMFPTNDKTRELYQSMPMALDALSNVAKEEDCKSDRSKENSADEESEVYHPSAHSTPHPVHPTGNRTLLHHNGQD